MYATVDDVRAEGVSVAQAADARLLALLEEASRTIDQVCGWFFEPRTLSLKLVGRGTPTIEPPYPPIRLDKLAIGSFDLSLDPHDLEVVGAPVHPGFDGPRITLRHGRRFPKRDGTVPLGSQYAVLPLLLVDTLIEAEGVWGYTEYDGTPLGRTPVEVRRACILLVLRGVPPLGDDAAWDARNRWRIVAEQTRDQRYQLAPIDTFGALTGDPEVDRILRRYKKPSGLGAA